MPDTTVESHPCCKERARMAHPHFSNSARGVSLGGCLRQFLRLTDGRFGLYSGVYCRSGFWLEGPRKFGGGGPCCCRKDPCWSPRTPPFPLPPNLLPPHPVLTCSY